ncbi:hypothetical protein [Vibrio parahaemolyticus]|uniref:hypothetical protein n=1 Tax=Vibrio parahaemolyticus TaxID=670 RepID=UPI001FAC17D6|nr:hypothetical protein [Vibrio parahaemolyticus]
MLQTLNSFRLGKENVWRTTKQGQELCAALPNEIIKPDISAIWAKKQAFVKAGEMSVEDFIADVDRYITERIDELDKNVLTSLRTPSLALVAISLCTDAKAALTMKVLKTAKRKPRYLLVTGLLIRKNNIYQQKDS